MATSRLYGWVGDYRQSLENKTLTRLVFEFLVLVSLIVLIVFPLIFYIWSSFWSTIPGVTGGEFTLSAYQRLVTDPNIFTVFENTIYIAVLGTFLTMALAIGMMVVTIKFDIYGSQFFVGLLIVQYLAPSFIFAIGWQIYTDGINRVLMLLPFIDTPPINIFSVWGIAVVGAIHYAGLVYLLSSGALRTIPRAMEEAGIVSGAGKYAVLSKISLRLALPSLAISAVIIFTRFAQSFGLPLILGLPNSVFVVATRMYVAIFSANQEFAFAAALGMILLAFAIVGLALQRWITGTRSKYQTVTGADSIEQFVYPSGKYNRLATVVMTLLVIFLYVLPFLSIALVSFQRTYVGFNFQYATWSLTNYMGIFVGTWASDFMEAFQNSLILSGVGAAVGMIVSAGASYIIVKSKSTFSGGVDFLTIMPIAIPGIIIGTAYLFLFLRYDFFGLYGTIWLIMIALIAKFIVFGTRATNSSLNAIGDELEEVAYISGAKLTSVFRKIYGPLIKDGFIAGYVILFIDFLKVLSIPLLLRGENSEVFSVLIFRYTRNGEVQRAAAVTVVLMILILVLYAAAIKFTDADVTEL